MIKTIMNKEIIKIDIHLDFQGTNTTSFFISSPRQKTPMNRRRTYRPQIPQIPADPLRVNPCDSRGPRRCVQPLKGLPGTRATDVSYRASVPAGHAGCEVAPSYRALSPAGERQNRSFKALSGKGSVPASPPPFRHTPSQPRPRPTETVWRNLERPPCRNETFTFSAKERDSETGLSYFGSRYYSSDLSIWRSVDPQAAKYPSLSPYVYCANNPVKLVDPNGEEVDDNLDKWKYNKDTKKLTWVSDAGGKYHQTVVETVNTSSGEKVNRTIDYDGAIGQLFDFSVISKKWDGIINGTLDVYSGYQTAKAGVMIMSEGSVVTNGAAFPVGATVFSAGAYQTVDGLMTISNAIAGRGVDMYEQQDMVRDICKSAGNSIASFLSTSKNTILRNVVKSIGRSIGSFIVSATWARLVRKATTHPTYNKALPAGAVVH